MRIPAACRSRNHILPANDEDRFPLVVGCGPVAMPPLHGRRAQLPVSPRPPVSWAPESTAGDEAYPHAPLAPQPPLHGRRGVVRSGMRRSHRDIAGTLGRPMFTLRTEVNLHNPLIPRPYKQNTVQPSAMPLSDTIVLAVRPNSPLRPLANCFRASEPRSPRLALLTAPLSARSEPGEADTSRCAARRRAEGSAVVERRVVHSARPRETSALPFRTLILAPRRPGPGLEHSLPACPSAGPSVSAAL